MEPIASYNSNIITAAAPAFISRGNGNTAAAQTTVVIPNQQLPAVNAVASARFDAPRDVMGLMLEYAGAETAAVTRDVAPRFHEAFAMKEINVLRDELRGASAFITKMADLLTEKKYPDQVRLLRKLAACCHRIELPIHSQINGICPSLMLSYVSVQVITMKDNLFHIFKKIKDPVDVKILSEAINHPKGQLQPPPFIKEIFSRVAIAQEFEKKGGSSIYLLAESCLTRVGKVEVTVQWVNRTMPNRVTRAACAGVFFSRIRELEPERVLPFFNASKHLMVLSSTLKCTNQMGNDFLNQGKANAWDVMMPPKAVVVSQSETEAVNKDLELIQNLLRAGKIKKACSVKTQLTEIDPDTNSLKFPKQCVEFFRSILALPKKKLAQLDPNPASASEEVNEARLQKTLEEILHFIVTYLPNDKSKNELLKLAKANGNFKIESLEQLVKKDNALRELQFPQTKYNDDLDLLIDVQSKEPVMLFRLARLLIIQGDIERAFEIGRSFYSPPLIFGFLNHLLNCNKLTADQEKRFLELAKSLPDVFKHLLITLANQKLKHGLAKQMEQNYDPATLKSAAERRFSILVNENRVNKVMKRNARLTEEDIYKICLLYRKARGEWRMSGYGKSNPIWGHRCDGIYSKADSCDDEGWVRLTKVLRSFESVMRSLESADATSIEKTIKQEAWPKPLIVHCLELARDQNKGNWKLENLIGLLQRQVGSYPSAGPNRETLDLATAKGDNLFITAKEMDEIDSSELIVSEFVRDKIKNDYDERELIVAGFNPLKTDINLEEFIPEIPRTERVNLFEVYDRHKSAWSYRGIDVVNPKNFMSDY